MNIQQNEYHGKVKKSFCTESFNISITYHKKKSFIPLHAHDKPYLCLSISGGYEEINYGKTIINPGTVIYRRANYEHANQFLKSDGLCLNLEFKDYESIKLKNGIKFPDLEFERRVNIDLSKLLIALQKPISNDILDIQCYESVLANFKEYNVKGRLKWVYDVTNYINDNPLQNISLNTLSQEFQLHPNYIIRKFKEITGLKLSEYLTKIRIEYSIQNLMQSKNKIGEIALDCGFYDQSHFSRSFEKQIGITPNKFKKMLNG